MIPRPGTKTEKAFEFIRLHTSARTLQICEHIGSSAPSVATLLDPYVKAGALLCCKVEMPGRPPQNEYRIGSGIRPLTMVDELHKFSQARPPRPDPFPAPAKETAPEPFTQSVQAAQVTRIELPNEISINEHGELRYQLDGKSQHLTPAQTRALGDFLFKTEGLWRTT